MGVGSVELESFEHSEIPQDILNKLPCSGRFLLTLLVQKPPTSSQQIPPLGSMGHFSQMYLYRQT